MLAISYAGLVGKLPAITRDVLLFPGVAADNILVARAAGRRHSRASKEEGEYGS